MEKTRVAWIGFWIAVFMLSTTTRLILADDSQPPNILMIVIDDASTDAIGAYGNGVVDTPALDRLAREGAVFKNAFCCNPKCSPSRASLLTGRYSWQLEEACNHFAAFPEKFKCYPHLLMESGFHAGHTGKGWGPGTFSTEHNPAGPSFNSLTLTPPYKGIRNVDYAKNFDAFLDAKPDDQPFCFWLGPYEPHRVYEKDSWKKESGMKLADAVVPPFYPDNDTVRGDLLDYAVEVKWVDRHVGLAVASLEQRGLLENTLIMITSDHGKPFPRIKGQVYEEGFHVPLVVYWKGVVQAGRTIDDFVNFPDIAPTIMDAVGMKQHPQMTGNSFIGLLKSDQSGQIDPARDHVLLGKERHDTGRSDGKGGINLAYPVRAIRNKDYLYVHNFKPNLWPTCNPEFGLRNCDPSPTKTVLTDLKADDPDYRYYQMNFGKRPTEELYNIRKDPHCIDNLADDDNFATIKQQLRSQMEKELTEQEDPRTLGQGDIFDRYPYVGPTFDYETGKVIPRRRPKSKRKRKKIPKKTTAP